MAVIDLITESYNKFGGPPNAEGAYVEIRLERETGFEPATFSLEG